MTCRRGVMEGKLGTVGAKAIAYKLSERKLHRKHMLCLRISSALRYIKKSGDNSGRKSKHSP
ncbi:hypothetical protein D3C86_1704040 [compost metagenome]